MTTPDAYPFSSLSRDQVDRLIRAAQEEQRRALRKALAAPFRWLARHLRPRSYVPVGLRTAHRA